MEENLGEIEDESISHKFLLVGVITSEDFQKSKYALTKLHKSFPKIFILPDIRPMLDVEWNQFITKYQRRLGHSLWSIRNRVAIFKNGEFMGDFNHLNEFIWKKWKYLFHENWDALASNHLIEYLESKTELCRHLVYMTVAIDNHVTGTLLFELYSDVVPLACENFMKRCEDEVNGYAGTSIHRIVKNSWIQCGGYGPENVQMRCENYVISHDRRGVLSTCNNSAHKDNTFQFFITLDCAPWMDYRYVAFGQLLHGDDVLKKLEDVPTYYQAPTGDVRIVKCGEFSIKRKEDESQVLYSAEEIDQWKEIQYQKDILSYLKEFHQVLGSEGHPDQFCPHQFGLSTESLIEENKMKSGAYSLKTDLKSYSPFTHLPMILDDADEGSENYTICEPDHPIITFKKKLWKDDLIPASKSKDTI